MQRHEALPLFRAALRWTRGRDPQESVRFASWLCYHYWSERADEIPDLPLAWTIYQTTHKG